MWTDVVDFRDFFETHRGQVARQLIGQAIREVWPDVRGQRLLGLGYPTPYLVPFEREAERTLAFMPATRGALNWPSDRPGKVSLVEETALPLPDYSIDRVLLVHSLEYTHHLPEVMGEVWRVLTGEGRILVVAPNRMGLWARADSTPLGWGHPYSASQLSRMLRDHGFTPARTHRALYVPPTNLKTILGSAGAWERVCRRSFPRFSGAVLLEATKQIYAVNREKERRRVRKPVLVSIPKAAGQGLRRNSD